MAMLIIDDSNWDKICVPTDGRCGTLARDYSRVPYGSIPSVPPAVIEPIPLEQWPDIIADRIRARSTIEDRWKDSPIGVLNQEKISYCHAFSSVMLTMLERELQSLPYVELSASSIGGPVTGWRNAGAYIHDDLARAVRFGTASTAFVPMLTTRKADCKPGWEADAAKRKVSEYSDIQSRNFVIHGTMLLDNHPVGVGLNYWGHAVTDVDVVDLYPQKRATDWTRYGIKFINSWGKGWGDNGLGVRTGNKALADSIYAILQVMV